MLKDLLFFEDAIPITICRAYPVNSKNAKIITSIFKFSFSQKIVFILLSKWQKTPENKKTKKQTNNHGHKKKEI